MAANMQVDDWQFQSLGGTSHANIYAPLENDASLPDLWQSTSKVLQGLLDQHEKGVLDEGPTEITRGHWKSGNKVCASLNCSKKFSLFDGHHHCRRCGQVFCKECTDYRRRLNHQAQPDPRGKLYKVCKACFDAGPQTVGQTRDWKDTFVIMRNERAPHCEGRNSFICMGDRKRNVDFEKECKRLKEGFHKMVVGSSLKRALNDVSNVISTPDWQKPPNAVYGNMATSCSDCQRKFGLLRKRHSCRVCGVAVCDPCSSQDLLVYIPNTEDPQNTEPQLAIIKIVGSPPKEPEMSLYLRVCSVCNKYQQEKQIAVYEKSLAASSPVTEMEKDVINQVNDVACELREVQVSVDWQLLAYRELVEALEDAQKGSRQQLPNRQSNMQTLAKAQCDLADHFTKWIMTLQQLRRLKPTTSPQMSVLRNMTRSKSLYYMENMALFRELQDTLASTIPTDMLKLIQGIVDQKAINCCHISLKQLALETLHLSEKHNLMDIDIKPLVEASQAVEEELKVVIERAGEDWKEHERCVDLLIQCDLKDHRLIRPSRRLSKQYGSAHIDSIIRERTSVVIQRVYLQLNTKVAHSSFPKSKTSLKLLCEPEK